MTHELKLRVGSPHLLRDHIASAAEYFALGTDIRHTLEDAANQIEEQLPKTAIEVTGFYYCPTAGEIEAPGSGGFDVCCDKPTLHMRLSRGAWDAIRAVSADQTATPKPAIEEPTQFGSVVRAGFPGQPKATANPLWTPDAKHGTHYWMSEDGEVEVWPELTDVEVLRVGLGEVREADVILETERTGAAIMAGRIHNRLQKLLGEAITSERKNALEKAIQAVEELAP